MANPSHPPVALLPPPPGTKANFINPPSQTAGTITLHTICLILVTGCVAIRLYTRKFIIKKVGLDDYCCLLAYTMTIVFSALLLVGDARGLGRHIWDVPASKVAGAYKMLVIAEWIYSPLVALIKLSCLMFYWRVFHPKKSSRLVIGGAICLLVCTYTGIFFATLFQCIPVGRNWNAETTDGHCLKPKGLPYASGAINVASDICVLLLPIPAIWALNMKLRRKLRLVAVFSLGTLAVVASIIRLAKTPILYSDQDRTWNVGKIEIWAVLEANVGIVCACLLTFPAFLDRYGGAFKSRLWSYVHILQSTVQSQSQNTSARFRSPSRSLSQGPQDKSDPFNESHSKLNEDDEGFPMPNITTSHVPDRSQHSIHPADPEYVAGDQLAYPKEVYRPKSLV